MANSRLTMIGLYNFDNDLFANLSLPDDLNRDDAINSILLRCGEMPVLYPNFSMCKTMIGLWSRKWYHGIERMIQTLDDDYNPLHNYDRYEKYSDNDKKLETNTKNSTLSESHDNDITDNNHMTTESNNTMNNTNGNTNTNDVSAFNDSNYQPSSKSTLTGTIQQTDETDSETNARNTRSDSGSHDATTSETAGYNTDNNFTHDGHLYGNIGVTTSQQMLDAELKLRSQTNIYDVIAEIFMRDFCIYVY